MSKPLKLEILEASAEREDLLEKRWPRTKEVGPGLVDYVEGIVEKVKRQGDVALVDLTVKFDGVRLPLGGLQVRRKEIEEAYEKVDRQQISAIESARKRIERLERKTLKKIGFELESEGIRVQNRTFPIRSVGCYVPGGNATYSSSLIMTTIPAKVAGVPRVVVCTPPRIGGEINPLILVAADICGVDEVFKVGGAQAIAALAHGTETIKPVEKIVGPGNSYVVAAKALVSKIVPIDMPAGPSEIIILADESADARLVALDMISQAEHGTDSISIVVTTSRDLAKATKEELEKRIASLPNRERVIQALSRNGRLLVCEHKEKAIAFVKEFAPEHIEVMMKDWRGVAGRISSAGLILIGKYTPVSASDYCLGTNHVLPTGGFSHVFSGLSVLNFVKLVRTVECSKRGLAKLRPHLRILAESEGLTCHALAVEERFKAESSR